MSDENPQAASVAETQQESWTLFTDSSSCVDGSGAGRILINPEGIEFTYALRFHGRWTKISRAKLVVKSYIEAEMLRDIEETFRTLRKINMKLNRKKCAFGLAKGVFLGHVVTADGIKPCPDKTAAVLQLPSPRTIKSNTPFVLYGKLFSLHPVLPTVSGGSLSHLGVKNVHICVDSKLVAKQVLGTYVAKEDNMVKYMDKVKSLVLVEVHKDKSIKVKEVTTMVEEDGPTWMTPIVEYLKEGTLLSDKKEARKAEYVIREIHEGSCSMHAGPRSVVAKAIRLGYYWPTMHRDTCDMIQKCNDYQIHRPITRSPQQPLTPITALWPFYKWGIDIAGPFPEGPGIKARLGEGNKNWVEELLHVLWAHCIMIKSSHGDTPFSLTYGTEAVIPTKIGMPTYRTAAVDVVSNDEEVRLNLDLLEERRERAAICKAKAKSKMMKYYNARVCGVTFRPCDFVYRSNDASYAVAGGKLGPK
nr:hypothetical protein [Tanacetum cinerariifolium]